MTDNVPMDQVLVLNLDDDSLMVVPPQDGDEDHVKDIKMFLWACLHRRNIDEHFDEEMADWLNSFSSEEFHEATSRQAAKVN